ncbi:DUF7573 domain-containing protein [Natranaeroarchaeum sulfidigenes]|uniref:DUF7573 domain-containing protein n=1 Tax=Natranaeroarchaeum sulfidigenes TaxID=2784880 RepID=A0A897MP49_9EURY|nr:hypothetical protein [Natranaeroarchaeum sulfidigenes]QSG02337.1 Uncharacterized protein AArcS_1118 [Natranaeroarchaeum sulfidigenes]
MPEDSSLTEFTEMADDQSQASPEDETDQQSTDAVGDTLTVTFTWSGDGGYCAECKETVARRWTSAGQLVCTDCKEW